VFFDELLQTESLIQLANQNQATVGSHSRSLEINRQERIERAPGAALERVHFGNVG